MVPTPPTKEAKKLTEKKLDESWKPNLAMKGVNLRIPKRAARAATRPVPQAAAGPLTTPMELEIAIPPAIAALRTSTGQKRPLLKIPEKRKVTTTEEVKAKKVLTITRLWKAAGTRAALKEGKKAKIKRVPRREVM